MHDLRPWFSRQHIPDLRLPQFAVLIGSSIGIFGVYLHRKLRIGINELRQQGKTPPKNSERLLTQQGIAPKFYKLTQRLTSMRSIAHNSTDFRLPRLANGDITGGQLLPALTLQPPSSPDSFM